MSANVRKFVRFMRVATAQRDELRALLAGPLQVSIEMPDPGGDSDDDAGDDDDDDAGEAGAHGLAEGALVAGIEVLAEVLAERVRTIEHCWARAPTGLAPFGYKRALVIVDFAESRMGDAAFGRLAAGLAHCPFLFDIVLDACAISDSGATNFAYFAACASLKNISVARNAFGADGFAHLLDALPVAMHSGLTLRASSNRLGERAGTLLARALARGVAFRALRLDDIALGDAGAQALFGALRETRASVHWLDVSRNGLGDACVPALAAFVRADGNMAALSATKTEIGDPMFALLVDALCSNAQLRTLNISSNRLGECSADVLRRAMLRGRAFPCARFALGALRPRYGWRAACMLERLVGGSMLDVATISVDAPDGTSKSYALYRVRLIED